MIKQLLEDV
jgi:hypothetical protein